MRHPNGFTLIEIVILAAIGAILAALSVPTYELLTTRARITQAVSQLHRLGNAEVNFYRKNGRFPAKLAELDKQVKGGPPQHFPYLRDIRLDHNGRLVGVLDAAHLALVSASRNEIALVPKPAKLAVGWRCGPNGGQHPVSALLLPDSCQDDLSTQ